MDSNKEGILLIATSITVLLSFLVAVLAVMLIYRKRKVQHQKEIVTMNEQFHRELLQAQLEAQQHTMQYIGREIHDNVGQKLTLAFLNLQRLDLDNEKQRTMIQTVASIINDSLTDLRDLSRSLAEPASLHTASLGELIEKECNRIHSSGICQVNFSPDETETLISAPAVKSFVLRIFQEFTQNSIRHAACTSIHVGIKKLPNGLELSASDDGKGFAQDLDTATGKGVGLQNMKRRAEIIGATLLLESAKNQGTRMSLFIPIDRIN